MRILYAGLNETLVIPMLCGNSVRERPSVGKVMPLPMRRSVMDTGSKYIATMYRKWCRTTNHGLSIVDEMRVGSRAINVLRAESPWRTTESGSAYGDCEVRLSCC